MPYGAEGLECGGMLVAEEGYLELRILNSRLILTASSRVESSRVMIAREMVTGGIFGYLLSEQ